jgi:hypothetical protein
MEITHLSSKALIAKNEWVVGAIFFLVSGILVPLLVQQFIIAIYNAGGYSFLINLGFGNTGPGPFITMMAMFVSGHYAAEYVNNRYEIKSAERIALIATLYFVLLVTPWSLYDYSSVVGTKFDLLASFQTFHFIILCAYTYFLYISTKKSLSKQSIIDI